MQARIVDELCCSTCRGELELKVFAEEAIVMERLPSEASDGARGADEPVRVIKEGALLCKACKVWYPIAGYVPVMLVFSTPFHQQFARKHADQLQALSGYRAPSGVAQPGEQSVQETFTEEWDNVQEDELSFKYTQEDLQMLNRKVWLRWLERVTPKPQKVLNIGCGLGSETEALQAVTGASEVFAVDLNFALLRRGEVYRARRGMHLVIASLFHLPLKGAFDLVYSQGVIHHTFSTERAFASISKMVKPGGRLFIWVYGLDDHLTYPGIRGLIVRLSRVVEGPVRPVVSRMPRALRELFFRVTTVLMHRVIRSRVRHKDKWKLRNTEHGLRDWLSPRYAHRHSYNQVFDWFEKAGFEIVDVQSPAAYWDLFQKQLWGVGVTGRKIADTAEGGS